VTAAILSQHLKFRRSKRDLFVARPYEYKVCDQCRSIAFAKARVCAVCHAYRWNESVNFVVRVARQIGENPFPLTAGVVPRLVVPD